ncbi:hypothetical protein [Lachnospira pectinoschiza]|uniref:hypothetical protein n=1 Tax=Lachnospira pectinoschiza TaxID=28052 RepID=UPI0015D66CE1|nr:hypothetical protein [Lachnospira pectinoschiza]
MDTGHTQIFSCLSYLEGIAIASCEQELILQALQYQDKIIGYFEDDNELEILYKRVENFSLI